MAWLITWKRDMELPRKPWLVCKAWWWGGLRRRPSLAILLGAMALLGLSWLQTTPSRVAVVSPIAPPAPNDTGAGLVRSCSSFYRPGRRRRVVFSIERFGGVGDGETSNTEAFRRAVDHLKKFGDKGGSQLNVPEGRWVTGSFNLTSNFTLFLEKGAVILGSQVFLWNSFEYK